MLFVVQVQKKQLEWQQYWCRAAEEFVVIPALLVGMFSILIDTNADKINPGRKKKNLEQQWLQHYHYQTQFSTETYLSALPLMQILQRYGLQTQKKKNTKKKHNHKRRMKNFKLKSSDFRAQQCSQFWIRIVFQGN